MKKVLPMTLVCVVAVLAQVSRAEVVVDDNFDGSSLNSSVWYTECDASTVTVDSSQLILSYNGGYGWFESVNTYAPETGKTLMLTTTNCQGSDWANGKAWGFKNVYLSCAGDAINGVAKDESANPINYWGDIFIVMTTTGNSADAQYLRLTSGNTWNGTFIIKWSATKVVVEKNSVVIFDSSVNAPDQRYGLGTSTWNIPAAASKIFASTYCGGILLFENMRLDSYEPIVLPEGVYLDDGFEGTSLNPLVWKFGSAVAVGSSKVTVAPIDNGNWMESVDSFAPATGETLVLSTKNCQGTEWTNGKKWGFKNIYLSSAGDEINGAATDEQGNPINYWGDIFIVMSTTGNISDNQYLRISNANWWVGDFKITWSAEKVTVKWYDTMIFDSTVNAPDSRYGLKASTWNIPTQAAPVYTFTYCNNANLVFDTMHLEGYKQPVLAEGVYIDDNFGGTFLNPIVWNCASGVVVDSSKVTITPNNSGDWMESVESFAPTTEKALALTTTNCLGSEWGNGKKWGFKNVTLSCAGDEINGAATDEQGNPINYWGDIFIVMNTTGNIADNQYLRISNGNWWVGDFTITWSAEKVTVKWYDTVIFDSTVNAPDSRYGLKTSTWNIPTQASKVRASAYVNGTSLTFDNMKLESVEIPAAALPGDFNKDGVVNATDIDLLYSTLAAGGNDSLYDVNGDGSVTSADVTYLVGTILKTYFGDANLDKVVNVSDLSLLAANYGTNFGAGWAMGDFTGDGAVNVSDLSLLAANYGSGSKSTMSWADAYAQVFGTTSDADEAESSEYEDVASSACSSLGLSLIAGLALMGLMIVKMEE